ncbi:MAG: hypothetical protein KF745_01910 [Phycisphaeraceae bacterium]|nr:hypothetical protein [Phycisphaeraceae bacterium]
MAARKNKPKPDRGVADAAPAAAGAAVVVPTLEGLLGQDRAVATLRQAMDSGRIHHAWIFSGPAGVGKFTAAVAFGALLLDPTLAPDLSGALAAEEGSETRRLIESGTHPDFHIVNKELAGISREPSVRSGKQRVIPVDVVREFLVEPAVRTRRVRGKTLAGKVFIVDEAELMRDDAQDTLLKTLEEPPEGAVIILVTASEEQLRPTVRSRCQRVAFGTLGQREMDRWLKAYADRMASTGSETAREISAKEAEWLAAYSGGSPGWAASAIENGLFGWHEALAPLLAQVDAGRLPPELGATMSRLVEERAAAWVKANPEASKESANAHWARRMFSLLAEHQRGSIRRAVVKGDGTGAALRAIDLLQAAERQIATNTNPSHVMENLAAQLVVRDW